MDMNDAIAYVLRAGVILSLILIIIGALLLFANNGSSGFSMNEITNVNTKINSSIFSLQDLESGILAYQGLDFILLGMVVLIATPATRVLSSVFAFIYEKNWIYVVITLIVFINLMVAVLVVPGMLGH
jgi:uncharacterized membrane protein